MNESITLNFRITTRLNDGGFRVREGGLVAVVADEPREAEEEGQLQNLAHSQPRRGPAQSSLETDMFEFPPK